ncbi:HNH endonuclease signature motif containing protein [Stenotrophomonas sp. PS02298]|uniref:HNH endonuclease signature motif containing protein n=1 Tax=Stenotrophomonas sp. PS02298 TaxID=2991424 RepID=UPI00249BB30A|nr:HNH endonuclease signature motif containing protein [Stenotrophomonas sp. PS02298]
MTHIAGATLKPLVQLPKNPEQCWKWLGRINDQGRPIKQFGGNPTTAQRWIWQMFFGPIPEGLVVYNTCGNRECPNPAHLACAFQADANRAGAATKLLPGDVQEIRAALQEGRDVGWLAARFDVAPSTIREVGRGSSWGKRRRRRDHPHRQSVIAPGAAASDIQEAHDALQ